MEDSTGLNVRPHLLCLWFVGFNACVLYAWLVFWYGHFSAVVLQVNIQTSSSLSRSSTSSHGVNYPPVPVFAARLSSGKRIDLFNRCLDVLLLLSESLILQIQQTPVSLCSLGRVDWLTVHRQGWAALLLVHHSACPLDLEPRDTGGCCVSSVAGCLIYKPIPRKKQAQLINTRQPLNIRLAEIGRWMLERYCK